MEQFRQTNVDDGWIVINKLKVNMLLTYAIGFAENWDVKGECSLSACIFFFLIQLLPFISTGTILECERHFAAKRIIRDWKIRILLIVKARIIRFYDFFFFFRFLHLWKKKLILIILFYFVSYTLYILLEKVLFGFMP